MDAFRRMMVESVRVNARTNEYIVLLKEVEQERYLAIFIGESEAGAIVTAISGVTASRPLAHDVFAQVLKETHTEVRRIDVVSLVDQIFCARVHLRQNGRDIELDARPSDAIALAVRVDANIYAAEQVLEEAGVFPEDETEEDDLEDTEPQGKTEVPDWVKDADLKLPDLGQDDHKELD